jgi:hypothetical protein
MPSREIEQARALLERAERESDPGQKADHLVQGLEALGDLEDDEISDADRRLIANIKVAHARRLLMQLGDVRSAALDTWARYVHVMLGLLKAEVRTALDADKQLREHFDRFVAMCDRQVAEVLREELQQDD